MVSKIKLLHLISSSGFFGAEHLLVELASHSIYAGIDTCIGVFRNIHNPNLDLAKNAQDQGLKVQIFPCNGRLDRKTIAMIKDYIRKEDFGIIHSHNYKSNFYAWRALKNSDNRWVITNHGRRVNITLMMYNLLNIFVMRHADRIVAVSRDIADEMIKLRIPYKKIGIIDNGIDIKRYSNLKKNNLLKHSFGFNERAKIIGCVGSLTREKGHSHLLDAARIIISSFPEVNLLIIGDGAERMSLELKTAEMGLEKRVIFTGYRNDIPEILSFLDVFILPSLKEGLPMALLEAMAAKVPVIGTKIGAIPKVIEDGISGMLISPGNPDAIAKAITTLLSDGDFAKEMARRGFEKVRDNFSSKTMAEKYIQVYRELLS